MPNIIREAESTRPTVHQTRTLALAGNPNAGKTTIFNLLTGARQHVANYPGVTVEIKEGACRHDGQTLRVVDLPGTYSLTAYSAEELVARNFLVQDEPDVVVAVLDASNLERNLYLAVQLMELGLPLVLTLNMWDLAQDRGLKIDAARLGELLGTPVVSTVGHKRVGREAILTAAMTLAEQDHRATPLGVDYGAEVEAEIAILEKRIVQAGLDRGATPARWLAVKLLEGDAEVGKTLGNAELLEGAKQAAERLQSRLDESPETLIAQARYAFIAGICQRVMESPPEPRRSWSDRIDTVVTSRIWGIPIFLGLMYLVFQLTFTLGAAPMEWIEAGFDALGSLVGNLWPADSESLLRSLLVDGVISGVGGVLVFLPNILLLFLAIAVLEDSGYMARVAFLMDRLMHKIGLHGKSFVPMLIGFGCSVPAIMATRTLESRRDRLVTMLVLPMMSCGARLPIYALIIPAFFPKAWQTPVLWGIYLIGIALAILCAKLLKATILRGETPPFVMELPPYRVPTLRSVLLHMTDRGWAYLKKAGTVILGISILLWAMQQWPGLPARDVEGFQSQRKALHAQTDLTEEARAEQADAIDHAEAEASLEASLMGRIGRGLEPVLRPCGFDWKISTSMVGAFAAKEVFVSQMGIVYSLGDGQDETSESLREKLQAHYTPLQAFCIMLFCLLSAPCMATIAVTRRESGSWKWAMLQLAGMSALAWLVTAGVYQAGRWLS